MLILSVSHISDSLEDRFYRTLNKQLLFQFSVLKYLVGEINNLEYLHFTDIRTPKLSFSFFNYRKHGWNFLTLCPFLVPWLLEYIRASEKNIANCLGLQKHKNILLWDPSTTNNPVLRRVASLAPQWDFQSSGILTLQYQIANTPKKPLNWTIICTQTFKIPRLSKIFTNDHNIVEMLLTKKLYEHKYN